VWKDKLQAYDAGEKAAAWLSVFLDGAYRLVFHPQHFEGRILNRRPDKWCSQARDEDRVSELNCIIMNGMMHAS
jgi:uncharacterized protein YcbX